MPEPDTYPCQLVNPYCPDDLCVLPYNHRGYHKLSTMSRPEKLFGHIRRVFRNPPMTEVELIHEGWIKQEQMLLLGQMR